jgi:hypothetical protein
MKDLKQPFRITIEHYNQKVSVEVLEQVLKGAGFLEESVTKMINQEF